MLYRLQLNIGTRLTVDVFVPFVLAAVLEVDREWMQGVRSLMAYNLGITAGSRFPPGAVIRRREQRTRALLR